MQVLHLQNERDAERNLAILGPVAVEVPPVGPALPPGVLVSSCSPHLPFVCVCIFVENRRHLTAIPSLPPWSAQTFRTALEAPRLAAAMRPPWRRQKQGRGSTTNSCPSLALLLVVSRKYGRKW